MLRSRSTPPLPAAASQVTIAAGCWISTRQFARAIGVTSCAAIAACTMLAGCAGPAVQGPQEEPPSVTSSSQANQLTNRPKESRMNRATSVKDILAEWGTFGADNGRGRLPRKSVNARSRDTVPLAQDYSLSVDEIVANASCHACEDKPFHHMVLAASSQHGVPAGLIHAVIEKESGYDPGATSPKQARGLMQLMPDTARFVGVSRAHSLYDPQININAGTAYLKYLMQSHTTFDKLLAAYNAGPGNVRKYNGVPPFAETRRYIRDVKRYYSATSKD